MSDRVKENETPLSYPYLCICILWSREAHYDETKAAPQYRITISSSKFALKFSKRI